MSGFPRSSPPPGPPPHHLERGLTSSSAGPSKSGLDIQTALNKDFFSQLVNPNPFPRVGQLDASLLDGELTTLLRDKLYDAFTSFKPEFKSSYSEELQILLKLILFKFTVWDHSATYGLKLQNLKLVNGSQSSASTSSKGINDVKKNLQILSTDINHNPDMYSPITKLQKLLYGFWVIGGEYAFNKLDNLIDSFDESDYEENTVKNKIIKKLIPILKAFSKIATKIYTLSSLFNFVIFLYTGKYSTLLLRLLHIRIVPSTINSQTTRNMNINFEFQNRQLVWNTFTEFLVFILPILNIGKLQKRIVKNFKKGMQLIKPMDVLQNNQEANKGPFSYLPLKTCAIAYEAAELASAGRSEQGGHSSSFANTDVTNPYITDCGHIYSYVSIAAKLEDSKDDEDGWTCLRCGRGVKSARPYIDINSHAIVCKVDNRPQEGIQPVGKANEAFMYTQEHKGTFRDGVSPGSIGATEAAVAGGLSSREEENDEDLEEDAHSVSSFSSRSDSEDALDYSDDDVGGGFEYDDF